MDGWTDGRMDGWMDGRTDEAQLRAVPLGPGRPELDRPQPDLLGGPRGQSSKVQS